MKVISLGWGVQSFTLAAMSALGELGPVDAAIHADTEYESSGTYSFAEKWTGWLEDHGVKVVTVQDTKDKLLHSDGSVMIPAFTFGSKGDGQLRRQCTGRWKIQPMRRWLQSNRSGQPVEQWIGISLDEQHRAKTSEVKYVTNRWPLLEINMTRQDCKHWLEDHGLEIPPKSSCVFCPYHNQAAWQGLSPSDLSKAIAYDRIIRDRRPPYPLFVHPARIPLSEVDLRTAKERGQLELPWEWEMVDDCPLGVCGV